ncbi:hypothetical protein IGI04_028095 [Brassica rapa subsp. trilocularis]|uniref:Knottin scorpion toxin-like domain-containing protein n=1 Tax=Brassica rapa subsp. trilocularis TaxID=1813537 RepID=A0ABQ7L139_BRACM|nr:hypothetical protein IGI04_028095 [Brassica rapa subsp. trilocularis]
MTKASIVAFFMIIFLLGISMQETQGQQMCHDLAIKSNCNDGACTNLCKLKWNGSGSCFQNQQVFSCLCNFIFKF